jgi:hypothetical protein
MFVFPQKTAFGKIIPKSRIYAHGQPTRRIQDLFTSQVAEIRWAHKLSPETLHLPSTPGAPEIEIFDIKLKALTLDEIVLETIDRAVPYPVLHRLVSEEGVAYSAAFKRPSEANASEWVVGARFTSGFSEVGEGLPQLPTALDLGHLYAGLMGQLLPLCARPGELLGDQVGRCDRHRVLSKQVDRLSAWIRKEKQFNRKVTLNQELKPLQEELQKISCP